MANTEPVSAPPGSMDTAYILKYENNSWNKVKTINIYPYGLSPNFFYSFNYSYNSIDNYHYFQFKDSIYHYETSKWKSIPLGSLANDTTLLSIFMSSVNNIHLLRYSNNSIANTTKKTFYYQNSGSGFILKDSIIDAASPTSMAMYSQFIPNISANRPIYFQKTTVSLNPSYSMSYDLYSIVNNKLTFTKSITSKSTKIPSLFYNEDASIYYLLHDYTFFSDTVEIFKLKNNVSTRLYTMLGQMQRSSSIFTFNNDVLIANTGQSAPFNNSLFRLVEKKAITADFSYNIQNMTVYFTKLDTACKNFIWDFGNGNTSSINPNPIVTYATPGTYSPCLKCGNSDPICAVITVPCNNCNGTTTGIVNHPFSNIKLYPNPSSDIVYIEGFNNNEKITLQLYSTDLKLIKTLSLENQKSIDVAELENGVYLLRFSNGFWYKLVKI